MADEETEDSPGLEDLPNAEQTWENLPSQWRETVEKVRLECEKNGVNVDDFSPPYPWVQHLRFIPLVHVMKQNEVLRDLFPFISHADLGLSDVHIYRGMLGNYPFIEAISEGIFRVINRRSIHEEEYWKSDTLFTGTAEQTAEFVAAEVQRRRLARL